MAQSDHTSQTFEHDFLKTWILGPYCIQARVDGCHIDPLLFSRECQIRPLMVVNLDVNTVNAPDGREIPESSTPRRV